MKKFKTMILSMALLFCFIVPSTFVFSGCGEKPNYDGMSISNWSNYNAFGAGYVSSTASSQNVEEGVISANKHEKKSRLFGKDKHGKMEEISFKKGEKTEEQTMNVCNFKSSSLMTFVQFQEGDCSEIGSFQSNPLFDEAPLYVIDNKTGNIYSIGEKFDNLYIYGWSEDYNSDTSAYLMGMGKTDAYNNGHQYLYRYFI